jgi:hypothetical protein
VQQLMDGGDSLDGFISVDCDLPAFSARCECVAFAGVNNKRQQTGLRLQIRDDFKQAGMKDERIGVRFNASGHNANRE